MSAPEREIVIQTDNLTKQYGSVIAVNNMSLQVPKGGVFGLLGPNGSGKTTTMVMLLGLVRPTRGSMRLFGEEFSPSHLAVLRRIGAIVDRPTFYPHLSGRANLQFFQGISRTPDPDEIERLLHLVGLSERARSKYSTYSMGMRQRLGIAYTLLGNPELLFLDEPTNGLDPSGVVEVRQLIRQLGSDGRTVMLSSHMLHEVEQVCDNVAILSRGQVVAQGNVKELLKRRGAVRLRTTQDGPARGILAALDWVTGVTEVDGYLMVEAPPERSAELTQALSQQAIYITEMAPMNLSLERFFLDVTSDEPAQKEPVQ